jgi:hypothetical protein
MRLFNALSARENCSTTMAKKFEAGVSDSSQMKWNNWTLVALAILTSAYCNLPTSLFFATLGPVYKLLISLL